MSATMLPLVPAIGYYPDDMMSRSFFTFIAISLALSAAANGAVAAQMPPASTIAPPETAAQLLPHKASYDIKLVKARSGSQIINVTGTMEYSWEPTCEGWVTDHKFHLAYDYAENPRMVIESRFSTLESFDGKNFRFFSQRRSNGELSDTVQGHAVLFDNGKGGKAIYEQPQAETYNLQPGTVFPIAHTMALLKHAKSNQNFLSVPLFDGSDAEGPVQVSAILGSQVKQVSLAPMMKNAKDQPGTVNGWPIHMAFFPVKDLEAVEPNYELRADILENGIITDMVIDYDSFSVTQKLKSIESLPKLNCKAAGKVKKPEQPSAPKAKAQ